jgi:serine/threonine-protein kinase
MKEALIALPALADTQHAPLVRSAVRVTAHSAGGELKQTAEEIMHQLDQRFAPPKEPTLKEAVSSPKAEIHTSELTVSSMLSGQALEAWERTKIMRGRDFSSLKPGDLVADRYRYVRKVGKGAFGTVLLMEDTMVHETIILKVLNPQVAADEDMIKRFVRELRFARKITHPNVIRIYDFLTVDGEYAISMEYFPSHTLSSETKGGQPLALERALRIARDVAGGMAVAHGANVVHRDLKPGNILINNKDVVKIVDFGISAARGGGDTKLTKTGLLMGTPRYMAPEQVLGKKIDERTDIYSLGIIMYEMLVGDAPYSGEDMMTVMYQHVHGSAVPVHERNPAVPETIGAIVMKTMAADPARRYQSMEELRNTLAG